MRKQNIKPDKFIRTRTQFIRKETEVKWKNGLYPVPRFLSTQISEEVSGLAVLGYSI